MGRYIATLFLLFARATLFYLLIIQTLESDFVTGFHINRQARRIVKPISSFIGNNQFCTKFRSPKIDSRKIQQKLPSFRRISSLSETTSATADDSSNRNDQYKVLAFMRKFITVLWRWASFPMRLIFSSPSLPSKSIDTETKTEISDGNTTVATALMADTTPIIENVKDVDTQMAINDEGESIEKENVITAASLSSDDNVVTIDEDVSTNTAEITLTTKDISSDDNVVKIDEDMPTNTADITLTTKDKSSVDTSDDNVVKIDENMPTNTADITISTKDISSVDSETETSTINSDDLSIKEDANSPTYVVKPKDEGNRWAVGAVDLSGDWQLIDNDEFKEEYEYYLTYLGQPKVVRAVALAIVGFTTEITKQSKEGRELSIRGRNTVGVWERCLVSSGTDAKSTDYEPIIVDVRTADGETVQAESWWEDDGKVHRSWMRGGSKYGGGDFESRRYLDNDGKVLVCESTFYPIQENREKVLVTWKFLRKGERI